MKRKKPAKVTFFPPPVELSIEDLVDSVYECLSSHENVEEFIVKLDLACQDWDVTYHLIQHFKALEQVYIDEVAEDEEDGKSIEPKLLKYD